MMMWCCIRIIENPVRIGDHFPDNALVSQQAQSVIYRRFGYTTAIGINQTKHIFGRKMGALRKQDTRNHYPLRSRVNSVTSQNFNDIGI